jgi:ATP-dependent RNA helicase RhlE
MLFSATISEGVAQLAASMLRNPSRVDVAAYASVPETIAQKVLFVDGKNKRALLTDILRSDQMERALVFTRTKHGAERIMRQLVLSGISADAIHSNKSQGARQRALSAFDRGRIRVLVATDIMARGIDVDGISHVINYDLPNNPEGYVHRIGRTARAGAAGIALSFCEAGEISMLGGIEKLTRCRLTPMEEHPFHSSLIAGLHKRICAPPALQAHKEGLRGFGRSNRPSTRIKAFRR